MIILGKVVQRDKSLLPFMAQSFETQISRDCAIRGARELWQQVKSLVKIDSEGRRNKDMSLDSSETGLKEGSYATLTCTPPPPCKTEEAWWVKVSGAAGGGNEEED